MSEKLETVGLEVLNLLPVSVLILADDWTVRWVSAELDTVLRDIGASPVTLGHDVSDLFPENDWMPKPERAGLAFPYERRVHVSGRVFGVKVTRFDSPAAGSGYSVIASDITDRAAIEDEAALKAGMVESAIVNMMFADRDNVITYVNPSSTAALKSIEHLLPVKAEDVVGSNVGIFHKDPSYQEEILSDEGNLPRSAYIKVGDEFLDLNVVPVHDLKTGEWIGSTATWSIATQLLREKADAELLANISTTSRELITKLSGITDPLEATLPFLEYSAKALGFTAAQIFTPGDDGLYHHLVSYGVPQHITDGFDRAAFALGEGPTVGLLSDEAVFVSDLGNEHNPTADALKELGFASAVLTKAPKFGDSQGALAYLSTEVVEYNPILTNALEDMLNIFKDGLDRIIRLHQERAAAEDTAAKVDRMVAVTQQIASGDLTAAFDIVDDGAIGKVVEALTHLVAALRDNIAKIASGSEEVNGAAQDVKGIASQISAASEELSAQVGQASAAAAQISSNVASVSAATEEMTASIREIAQNSTQAATVSSHAVEEATQAQKVVTGLNTASVEIGDVLKVIASIAQQTNLLALNATIEAARAGDAGKGFAVVANEVKDLAKESAAAAEDIARKVQAIQDSTGGVSESLATIASTIAEINQIQVALAAAAEEQAAVTNEIARSVAEVSSGVEEISRTVAEVTTVAQENSAGAAKALAGSESLESVAADLTVVVGTYRL